MRFLCTLILAFLCFNCSLAQSCFPNGITFSSQEEIDNFATDYPDCTEILGYLWVGGQYSPITNLDGLSQLTAARSIAIEATDLNDLSGLENISGNVEMLSFYFNTALENLDELSGIESLWELDIFDNPSLNDISGLSNIELDDAAWLYIDSNPNLSFCSLSNICNFISTGGSTYDFYIQDNASGCNSLDEILLNCSELARIKNLSFYDVNQNQIQDAGEPYYSDISVTLTPGDIEMFGSPAIQYVETGNYTATYNEADDENWSLTTDSTSYFLSVGGGEEVTFAFGMYPSQFVSQLTSFITSPPARCNEDVIFNISTRNTGTTTASGTMWLQIDDNVTQTNFITPPDTATTTSPVYYGWYFTDLYPGEMIFLILSHLPNTLMPMERTRQKLSDMMPKFAALSTQMINWLVLHDFTTKFYWMKTSFTPFVFKIRVMMSLMM